MIVPSKDPLSLQNNLGILGSSAYLVSERIKKYKITTIVSMPDPCSAAFGAIIVSKYKPRLSLSDALYGLEDVIYTFITGSDNIVVSLPLSRDCVQKRQ